MGIWGNFQGITKVTRRERGSKILEIGITSFIDEPYA